MALIYSGAKKSERFTKTEEDSCKRKLSHQSITMQLVVRGVSARTTITKIHEGDGKFTKKKKS
jgi:hypothetical protein